MTFFLTTERTEILCYVSVFAVFISLPNIDKIKNERKGLGIVIYKSSHFLVS
jgi:hypothetical protein